MVRFSQEEILAEKAAFLVIHDHHFRVVLVADADLPLQNEEHSITDHSLLSDYLSLDEPTVTLHLQFRLQAQCQHLRILVLQVLEKGGKVLQNELDWFFGQLVLDLQG